MYIIILANENGTRFLIDISMSGDRSVIKKEVEKILKFKDLAIAIQSVWYVKANW